MRTFTQELREQISSLRFPTLWERLTPDAVLMVDSIKNLERREYIEGILKRYKFYIEVPFGDAHFIVKSLDLNQDVNNFSSLFK